MSNLDFNDAPYQNTDLSPNNPVQSFKTALFKAKLGTPDEIIPDGQLHRFQTPEDKSNKKTGWYVFYQDGTVPAGAAGDWRHNIKITWSAKTDLSPEEQQEQDRKTEEIKHKRKEERQRIQQETAKKAQKIWNEAKTPGIHPYLHLKQVESYGLRQDKHGNLLVPVCHNNQIYSLQLIDPSGNKKFLTGGAIRNCYYVIPGQGKKIYITEGYATAASVFNATGATCIIAFNAGNLQSVCKQWQDKGHIVVCADNDHKTPDNPGITAAKKTGQTIIIPEGIQGTDFNDLQQEKGLQEVKQQLNTEQIQNKFQKKFISGADLDTKFFDTLQQGFLVKDVLPESSLLNVMYGPPGTYKSFLALDMSLSIATGIPWQEKTTKQRQVLYSAAEGQAGTLKRIYAWKKYKGIEDLDRFTLMPMPCLVDNNDELNQFLQAIKSIPEPPSLVVLDTLARSMTGDENSTADMGKVVQAAGYITEAIGSQVLIVHHTGKDESKGPRGAIALLGATDTIFRTYQHKEKGQVILKCERQKDDEPFQDMGFDMEVVDTEYANADMIPVTSLVPILNSDIAGSQTNKESSNKTVKGKNLIGLQALEKALEQHGEKPSREVKKQMDDPISQLEFVVHEDSWRKVAYSMGISDGDTDSKKKAFSRAREKLLELKKVQTWDGYYWKV